MNIKILGTGCKRCEELYNTVKEVVNELGVDSEVEKVTDLKDILGYGVMKTPGLVINEKVQVSGRVPSKDEIRDYINKNM